MGCGAGSLWRDVVRPVDAKRGRRLGVDERKGEERFGGQTPEQRAREADAYLWTVVAKIGQIFGDPSKGSDARVTNGLRFSYPGYNEILSGFADPRIDSNDRKPNPNVTVLEWLNGRPGFQRKGRAFARRELCRGSSTPTAAISTPTATARPSPMRSPIASERSTTSPPICRHTGARLARMRDRCGAIEYLKKNKPRVLYVMLGETDEWAHGRRYDLYLDAAWRNDRFIRRLWETAQSMPEYQGDGPLSCWPRITAGATPARTGRATGRRFSSPIRSGWPRWAPASRRLALRSGMKVTQSQIAATIAMLLARTTTRAGRRRRNR